MLLEHEGNYGLSMDALVNVCFWNTNGSMIRAWMLWSAHSSKHERNYGLVSLMLLEQERNYGLGMDALVSVMLLEHERNYDSGMDALVSELIKTRTELWFGHGCSGQRDAFRTRTELWFGHGCSGRRDAFGTRTNLLALAVLRESRKLQKCSIHGQRQRKQAP